MSTPTTDKNPAASSEGTEEEEQLCVLCCTPIDYVAFGQCNHRHSCAVCLFRLRHFYHNKQCPYCKAELDQVIYTEPGPATATPKPFQEYDLKAIALHDRDGNYFESPDFHKQLMGWLETKVPPAPPAPPPDHITRAHIPAHVTPAHVTPARITPARITPAHITPAHCPRCEFRARDMPPLQHHLKGPTSSSFALVPRPTHPALPTILTPPWLGARAMGGVRLRGVMGSLCLEHRPVFLHEQQLYRNPDLIRHLQGALEEEHFPGHPPCQFCHVHFFDEEALRAHMNGKHERCFLCERAGIRDVAIPLTCPAPPLCPGACGPVWPQIRDIRDVYYPNYECLEDHFRHDHFLCPQPDCLEKKFVAFASELDFKAHELEEHSRSTSMRIELQWEDPAAQRRGPPYHRHDRFDRPERHDRFDRAPRGSGGPQHGRDHDEAAHHQQQQQQMHPQQQQQQQQQQAGAEADVPAAEEQAAFQVAPPPPLTGEPTAPTPSPSPLCLPSRARLACPCACRLACPCACRLACPCACPCAVLPAHVPAVLPAHVPAVLPAHVPAVLPAHVPAVLPAHVPAVAPPGTTPVPSRGLRDFPALPGSRHPGKQPAPAKPRAPSAKPAQQPQPRPQPQPQPQRGAPASQVRLPAQALWAGPAAAPPQPKKRTAKPPPQAPRTAPAPSCAPTTGGPAQWSRAGSLAEEAFPSLGKAARIRQQQAQGLPAAPTQQLAPSPTPQKDADGMIVAPAAPAATATWAPEAVEEQGMASPVPSPAPQDDERPAREDFSGAVMLPPRPPSRREAEAFPALPRSRHGSAAAADSAAEGADEESPIPVSRTASWKVEWKQTAEAAAAPPAAAAPAPSSPGDWPALPPPSAPAWPSLPPPPSSRRPPRAAPAAPAGLVGFSLGSAFARLGLRPRPAAPVPAHGSNSSSGSRHERPHEYDRDEPHVLPPPPPPPVQPPSVRIVPRAAAPAPAPAPAPAGAPLSMGNFPALGHARKGPRAAPPQGAWAAGSARVGEAESQQPAMPQPQPAPRAPESTDEALFPALGGARKKKQQGGKAR
ncbi:putative zinc finger protein [Paratrimastix pyriformis]|uniref:Zinc finger protein n=1 Tax=Paratrimastix pyriformis TaxID=342808 RepID=A0ABQ8UP74_9EUKA|nr:putative zinc finger protein [Paratrimastix pyriformis]